MFLEMAGDFRWILHGTQKHFGSCRTSWRTMPYLATLLGTLLATLYKRPITKQIDSNRSLKFNSKH